MVASLKIIKKLNQKIIKNYAEYNNAQPSCNF